MHIIARPSSLLIAHTHLLATFNAQAGFWNKQSDGVDIMGAASHSSYNYLHTNDDALKVWDTISVQYAIVCLFIFAYTLSYVHQLTLISTDCIH